MAGSNRFIDITSDEHQDHVHLQAMLQRSREQERKAYETVMRRRSKTSASTSGKDLRQTAHKKDALVERQRHYASLGISLSPQFKTTGMPTKRHSAYRAVSPMIETMDLTGDDGEDDNWVYDTDGVRYPSNSQFKNPLSSPLDTTSRRKASRSDTMDNEHGPVRSDLTTPKRHMSVESDAGDLFVPEETPAKKRRRNESYPGAYMTPAASQIRPPPSLSQTRPPPSIERQPGLFGTQARSQHKGPRSLLFKTPRGSTIVTQEDLQRLFGDLTTVLQENQKITASLLEDKKALAAVLEVPQKFEAFKQEVWAHIDKSFVELKDGQRQAIKEVRSCVRRSWPTALTPPCCSWILRRRTWLLMSRSSRSLLVIASRRPAVRTVARPWRPLRLIRASGLVSSPSSLHERPRPVCEADIHRTSWHHGTSDSRSASQILGWMGDLP